MTYTRDHLLVSHKVLTTCRNLATWEAGMRYRSSSIGWFYLTWVVLHAERKARKSFYL